MDTNENDSELDFEDDQSVRELKKRRRVSERKDYKKSGWWQELQQEKTYRTTRARPPNGFAGTFVCRTPSRSWWSL